MKRIKTFAVAAIAVMLAASGCSKTPQVSEDNAEALKEATKEELEQVLSPSEYKAILKEHKYKLGFKYLKF